MGPRIAPRRSPVCDARWPTRWSSSTAAPPTRASCARCCSVPSSRPARSTPAGWTACTLRGEIVPDRHADIALLQAAIELGEADTAAERARFFALARRGRPQAAAAVAHTVVLRRRGHSYRLTVAQVGPGRHRVSLDGAAVEVEARRLGAHERRIELDGRAYRTLTSLQGADMLVEVDGVPHRISRDEGGVVRNLAPAVVVSIPVEPGDEVEQGDVVAVVESMKMESSLTAPFRARVREVMVGANVSVAAQEPLLRLERLGDARRAATPAASACRCARRRGRHGCRRPAPPRVAAARLRRRGR